MARLPRVSLAGLPHHVVQRGNNRQAIFVDAQDREFLVELLGAQSRLLGVALHAYVLMDNHFHLIATPDSAQAMSLLMQSVGRRYVRYFNQRTQRTGTLWEGRYRSALVQPETYLLTCMAYVDLNPVRAGLAVTAADFPWSSYGHYAGQRVDRAITPHPLVWAMGNTPFAREAAYVQRVRTGVSESDQRAVTESVLHGWALGAPSFVADLQKSTPRRLAKGKPGRPVSRKILGSSTTQMPCEAPNQTT